MFLIKHLLLPLVVLLSSCVSTQLEPRSQLDNVGVGRLPADYLTGSSDQVDVLSDPKAADRRSVHDQGESISTWLKSFNSPELEQLVKSALNRNYDLRQQALDVSLAEQNVKITRATVLPTLNFLLK